MDILAGVLVSLLAFLVLGLLAALGIVGVGWIVIQVFPALSLWQASLLALATTTIALLVAHRLLSLSLLPGPFFEWEEDEVVEEPRRHRRKSR